MARRPKRSQRFRKGTSDRSGFDTKQIQLIKDNGIMVAPEEFDEPPPSKKSLGGEAEATGDARNNSDFSDGISALDTPPGHDNPVFEITAAGGITPQAFKEPMRHPFMRVTGSGSAINITADPQIVRGRQGDILTLVCTDSDITLDHGTGLNLMASSNFIMDSGSVISFFYTTGGTVWNETSRSRRL